MSIAKKEKTEILERIVKHLLKTNVELNQELYSLKFLNAEIAWLSVDASNIAEAIIQNRQNLKKEGIMKNNEFYYNDQTDWTDYKQVKDAFIRLFNDKSANFLTDKFYDEALRIHNLLTKMEDELESR